MPTDRPDRKKLEEQSEEPEWAQVEHSGLQLPERFGVYLWWPQNDLEWIHPDDVELCQRLIPSTRIFQRQVYDATFNQLEYGPHTMRVKPTLWLEVKTDGYLIGDRVEIRSRMGKRRPAIATIVETLYNRQKDVVEYQLRINDNWLNEPFVFKDIQPAFKLDEPLDLRQRALADRSRLA